MQYTGKLNFPRKQKNLHCILEVKVFPEKVKLSESKNNRISNAS